MRNLATLTFLSFWSVFAFSQNLVAPCAGVDFKTVYLEENLSGGVYNENWSTQVITGASDWFIDNFSGNDYVRISNFNNGVNNASEAWLISPAMNLSGADSVYLNFKHIANYDGAPLDLLVSTNYNGSGVLVATWTSLSDQPDWDTDLTSWGNFKCSGNINLTPYISSNTTIAFKYTGTNTDGSTHELDDLIVFEPGTDTSQADALPSSTLLEVNTYFSNGVLTLQAETALQASVTISNSLGALVHQTQMTGTHCVENLHHLDSGVYIVTIQDEARGYLVHTRWVKP